MPALSSSVPALDHGTQGLLSLGGFAEGELANSAGWRKGFVDEGFDVSGGGRVDVFVGIRGWGMIDGRIGASFIGGEG